MQSSNDILEWFKVLNLPTPEIIRYPDLEYIPSIAINPNNCKFLLYEQQERVGHWTILFYSDVEDMWLFFDPYAINMDDQLKFSWHKDMELTDQMIEELDDEELEMDINHYRYQDNSSSNCGKICAVRYLFDILGYSIDDFKGLFYEDKSLEARDMIISVIYDVLGDGMESIKNISNIVEAEVEEISDVESDSFDSGDVSLDEE